MSNKDVAALITLVCELHVLSREVVKYAALMELVIYKSEFYPEIKTYLDVQKKGCTPKSNPKRPHLILMKGGKNEK